MKIKTLSYNTHKFFNLSRTRYFLKDLKSTLEGLDLDLVFLQELRGVNPKRISGNHEQSPLEELADSIWDHHIYGKNAIYSNGHHGNAILSKWPFESWDNIDISNHRFEQRGLLSGRIITDEGVPLLLACTHLDLTSFGRKRQLKRIQESLPSKIRNCEASIFCGDFNDWGSRCVTGIERAGYHCAVTAPTFPTKLPFLTLDRVFFKNLILKESRVLKGKPWTSFSDHLPIYSEFNLLPQSKGNQNEN